MTDTKTRAPRVAREYGMLMDLRVFVPVDKKNFKSQTRVSEATDKALSDNDLSGLLDLPGFRIISTNARFEAVKPTTPTVEVEPAPAQEGAQSDIEEAITDAIADDSGEDGKAGDQGEDVPKEAASGRRRRP